VIDPLGKLLTEIRDDPAVAALTSRVRGGEPAPGDSATPFQRFVVLVRLGATRKKRAPVQEVRIAVRCYGSTYQDAAALYGAVSDAIHNVGPRIGATGVLIHRSFDDIGMGASKDPDTGQPHEDGVIQLFAATQVVTA
jgi:hypothetical protein